MVIDITDLLIGNRIQVNYFKGLMAKRGPYTESAFQQSYDATGQTILDLALHGISALNRGMQMLEDYSIKFENTHLIPRDAPTAVEKIVRSYETTLDKFSKAIQTCEYDKITGELKFIKTEERRKEWVATLSMHE